VLLLCGTLFFTPDIFVSRYITAPILWLQAWLGIGLLLYAFLKKGNIDIPPPRYIGLILAWFFYHMVRGGWSFESLVNYMTVITVFLVFYWYWKEVPQRHISFAIFVCLGLIVSIWGLGQYLGWISETYSLFTMTGPFNNPAGISASLALLFPFSLYSCYKSKGKTRWANIIVSLLMSVTVILCGARAGILGIAVATFLFTVHLLRKERGIKLSFFHHVIIALACILLLGGLYFMKKDSADGRLLIWQCSGQLVKQAPLSGHGKNGFTAYYMTEQANYFSRHPQSKFAMLADNTSHPFNEFMKEVVEYGAIGFLLLAMLVVIPLYQSRKKHSLEIIIVRLSLLSIGICSFFSYPLYYPFIRLMIVLLLAYLVAEQERSIVTSLHNTYFSKSTIGIVSIFILVIAVYQVRIEYKWNKIADNSLSGFTEEMLPEYQELYSGSYLKENALFLYNYASELNQAGEYANSNIILLECCNYMNDLEVQMLMASNFEKMNDVVSAEQSLILISRMVPVRFFPLYRLAKLHEKKGDKTKAREVAERIICKEIKIPSMKITVMKNEMEELITKHQTNE